MASETERHLHGPSRLSILNGVAPEILARPDVRIYLDALLICVDEAEDRREHPTICQLCIEQIPILVRITREVVGHGELRLDDRLIEPLRIPEDGLVYLPPD